MKSEEMMPRVKERTIYGINEEWRREMVRVLLICKQK